MLPDFIKLKEKLAWEFHINSATPEDPLLGSINFDLFFEGNEHNYETVDGQEKFSKSKLTKSEFKIDHEELIKEGIIYFAKIHRKAKNNLHSKITKNILSEMDKATEKTGNRIDAKGEKFSVKHLLDALKKIPLDFDESGKPYFPTLFVSPKMAESLSKRREELSQQELEHRDEFEKLIEKKRREWNDRESNRKLVD